MLYITHTLTNVVGIYRIPLDDIWNIPRYNLISLGKKHKMLNQKKKAKQGENQEKTIGKNT